MVFFRSSSLSYFETESIMSWVMIMAVINFFEVGRQMCWYYYINCEMDCS